MREAGISRRRIPLLLAGAAAGASGVAGGGVAAGGLRPRMERLLKTWCDGLIALQIDAPGNPSEHGAFRCPACGILHGLGPEAVYPMFAMARRTGEERYRKVGLRALNWSINVDARDGAWWNELSPQVWKGTTVFRAGVLRQTLERFGEYFETAQLSYWRARLRRAGRFIRREITYGYGNINYPLTASMVLRELGRMYGEREWESRGHELAKRSVTFYTEPNRLLFGEGRPIGRVSPLGCRPVDLGYNIEESLPALLHYARGTGNREVGEATKRSIRAHLAFMLPDGGWDNSWGTRNFKWSYWGTRTAAGSMEAMVELAKAESVFSAAAERSLALLERCTSNGMLHGGPHCASRGAKPCVYHSLFHARTLATALDEGFEDRSAAGVSLPREAADGVSEYAEIGTWLAARGPWRATVTRNDWIYEGKLWHATGGAMSLLYHAKAGPVLASSLAEYTRIEPANMQPMLDAEDYPLTMRVERVVDGQAYSTLYDLRAEVKWIDRKGAIEFEVRGELRSKEGASGGRVALRYRVDGRAVTIEAEGPEGARLVVPLIADKSEAVRRVGPSAAVVSRVGAQVRVSGSGPLMLRDEGRTRVFNFVPGLMAAPVWVDLRAGGAARLTISI